MEEKEALVFASIWNRNRLAIYSNTIEEANKIFSDIRLFIPQYRQLFICGDIPKEIKYLKGVKIIETRELDTLLKAFKECLAEEEMGASPVQIVYFNAGEEVFEGVLKDLDRGWIATTACEKVRLNRESFPIHEKIRLKEGVVYLFDPIEEDIFIEKKIIEETKNSSIGVRKFMIQMMESQVHLAFEAIQNELELGKNVTQSCLSEILDIREKSLKKIINIGRKERRLDISKYIEETPPQIVKFLQEISSIKEVSLAAVFNQKNLIGYAKYQDIVFPTQNFLRLSDSLKIFSDTKFYIGNRWVLELNAKNKNILIHKNNYLYGFIVEKGVDPAILRLRIEKMLRTISNDRV